MTNKQKYKKLLETGTNIPLFSHNWWMDAVCGEDSWDVLLVEKNNEVIASLPYYKKKKYGLTAITQPPLTQTNGIWIKYPEGQKYARKLSYEKEVMNDIIDQLDKLEIDYFNQNFHYSITNWLPFYWAGFAQSTRYTYRLNNIDDLDYIWMGFSENIRREIRKAEKKIEVRTDFKNDDFIRINNLTFHRQGMQFPHTQEFIKRLDSKCSDRNARKMFFAEDAQGRIHAVIYLVWDSETVYYLMGGGDPKLRNSGATSLLMWEAIQYAATMSKNFDFEGSMIEPVERFFRAFGAIQTPYYNISKMSRKMKMAYHGKEIIKTIINR